MGGRGEEGKIKVPLPMRLYEVSSATRLSPETVWKAAGQEDFRLIRAADGGGSKTGARGAAPKRSWPGGRVVR